VGVHAAGSQPQPTDTPPPAGADAPDQPPAGADAGKPPSPNANTGLPQSGAQGANDLSGDQLYQQFMNGQLSGDQVTDDLVKQMQDQTLQQNIMASTRTQTGATMQQAQRQSYHSDADQRTTTNEQRATNEADTTRNEGARQDNFQDRGRTRSSDRRSGERANLTDVEQRTGADVAGRRGTEGNVAARRQALMSNLAKRSNNNPGNLRDMAEQQIGRQSDQAFLRLPQSKQTPGARQFIKAFMTMRRLQQLRQEVRQARENGEEVPEGLEDALDQAIEDAGEDMPELPAELAGSEFDVQEDDSTDESTEAGEEADEAAEESGLRADQTVEGQEGEDDSEGQGEGRGQAGTEGGQGVPANFNPSTLVNYGALRNDPNFGLLSTAGSEHAEAEGNLSTDSRLLGSIESGGTRVFLQRRGQQVRVARVGGRAGEPGGEREDEAQITLNPYSTGPYEEYHLSAESGGTVAMNEWQLRGHFERQLSTDPNAEYLQIGDRRVYVEDLDESEAQTQGIPTRLSMAQIQSRLDDAHTVRRVRVSAITPGSATLDSFGTHGYAPSAMFA
jgi:hypothetical protein